MTIASTGPAATTWGWKLPRRARVGTIGLIAVLATATLLGPGLGKSAGAVDSTKDLAAVSAAIGHPVHIANGWAQVLAPDGERKQARIPGVGLVQTSAANGEVDQLIYSNELVRTSGNIQLSLDTARATAASFGTQHYAGFGGLALRHETVIDHRIFREDRFVWQGRQGTAWLPQQVIVGVNADDGHIAYYWSERVPTTLDTNPSVSASAAVRSALATTGFASPSATTPELEVVLDHQRPRLVWVTTVTNQSTQRFSIPTEAVVWTDAATGSGLIVAETGLGTTRSSGQTKTSAPVHPPLRRPASAVAIPGSCYDAVYFDGLDTRYAASHCAAALNSAGYAGGSYDNATALSAYQSSATAAVFFHAGHSLDLWDNGCIPSCTGPHAAVALLYESANQNGDLDALAASQEWAAEMTSPTPTESCSGTACHSQSSFVAYPWGYSPQNYNANLVVLESCATAAETAGNGGQSFADTVAAIGAGTVVGFVDDVTFPVSPETNTYGDAWANTFWADLGAGETYATALVDAANSVGSNYGYASWVELQRPSAPNSLYPAQYKPVGG